MILSDNEKLLEVSIPYILFFMRRISSQLAGINGLMNDAFISMKQGSTFSQYEWREAQYFYTERGKKSWQLR
jgi:hypothetical protein